MCVYVCVCVIVVSEEAARMCVYVCVYVPIPLSISRQQLCELCPFFIMRNEVHVRM